jgi:voltage-dependent potassium channel beta subunit
MEYRYLGSSGLQVSSISLGAWLTYGGQVGLDTTVACMKAAWDLGVNFFDNAEAYGDGEAERVMGQAIRKMGLKRSDLIVSTKIFWGGQGPNDRGLSRKHVMEGVAAALDRLQLDYVDMVFAHRPDLHTPIEETVRAMNAVIDNGHAFYWGTSEWSADQIMEAVGIARREHLIAPQMEQPQYNMFHRDRMEREYARLYDEIGLGTTIWSPLASGVYALGAGGAERIAKVKRLTGVAEEAGCTTAQLAIAWCLKNPNVSTVITGASKPEQVRENVKALDIVARLDDDAMGKIENILDNRPEPPMDFR